MTFFSHLQKINVLNIDHGVSESDDVIFCSWYIIKYRDSAMEKSVDWMLSFDHTYVYIHKVNEQHKVTPSVSKCPSGSLYGACYFNEVNILKFWRPPWGPMSLAPMAASSRIDRGCTRPVKNDLILAGFQVDFFVEWSKYLCLAKRTHWYHHRTSAEINREEFK